jgi:hypothetical protein
MVTRASGPLFIAYVMIFFAGALFLITPSLVLAESTDYSQLVVIWGLFYLVGGLVSVVALLSRGTFFKNNISLWYFEVSGIALSVTANLVYAYALAKTGFFYGEPNIVALALILLAFSSGLIARCIETLRLVRILVKMSRATGGTQQ